MLRIRLGPSRTADHVLGWRVATSTGDTFAMTSHSPLMDSTITLVVGDRIVSTTSVTFRHRLARPIWTFTLPFHPATVPYLLRRAAYPPSRGDR